MSVVRAEISTCYELSQRNESVNDHSIFSGCSVSFDKSLCWLKADYGAEVERPCPFTYCPTVPGCEQVANTHMVTRVCGLDGEWQDSNYSRCITVLDDYQHCIKGFCRLVLFEMQIALNTRTLVQHCSAKQRWRPKCPDPLREFVVSVSLTLSIVSVALLVAAILLFSIFDSIQEWLCKTILWFVIYFQVASVMWMLIEGAYLYSRFTVFAMRHNDAPWFLYMACGWGVPFVVVICWTAVHEYKTRKQSTFCWVPYVQGNHLWILAGTMGFAWTMNFIFLLGIVIILVQKLRSENSAESKKIWRTIKATLLLVPLLGVSNIPLFYEPDKPSAVYMLGSAILQHSQGIFIAVLYCFLNSEIQNAVKRQLSKVPIEFFKPRQRFETERTYVPENRNVTKHGVPMEELNGAKKLAQETTPLNQAGSSGVSSVRGFYSF
ncbi:unnamed protein product [Nippostrongylus brasiliensis]|uniref:G_PROTEIN_RECEP_F2_4 domain-containing protein n=1 Tax=Nippostrongylus brasiliensis TaxID=27835 RepID=A0A158QX75_NIPBR|nr:unnamed protein product [Nippostrongylus brasiliensis]